MTSKRENECVCGWEIVVMKWIKITITADGDGTNDNDGDERESV